MEIILKETIDNLGELGDVVKVKAGYGRNYLLPRKLAVLATKGNLAMLEQEMKVIEQRRTKQKGEADALAKKIRNTTVLIEQRVGEGDKLYGSVTNSDIAEALAAMGITIDKRKILLEEPIKTISENKVTVRVGYQMTTELQVNIVPLQDAKAEA